MEIKFLRLKKLIYPILPFAVFHIPEHAKEQQDHGGGNKNDLERALCTFFCLRVHFLAGKFIHLVKRESGLFQITHVFLLGPGRIEMVTVGAAGFMNVKLCAAVGTDDQFCVWIRTQNDPPWDWQRTAEKDLLSFYGAGDETGGLFTSLISFWR